MVLFYFLTSPREQWRTEYHRTHLGLHCKEAVRIIFILCLGMTQPALRAILGAEPPRAGFHASTLLCIDIIPTASKQLRISSSGGTLPSITPLHYGNITDICLQFADQMPVFYHIISHIKILPEVSLRNLLQDDGTRQV